MENLKNDGYAGIDIGTCMFYSLGRIDKPSLKTAVQICKSQDSYSVNFHACASYLTMMVQKSTAAKQFNIAATTSNVDGAKLKSRDGTDSCLPPEKYSGRVYKMLSPKQKQWLWQDCKKAKANGEDIPMAKKRHRQPPAKQAKFLESVMVTQKCQISSITAQNQKMMAALVASGFKIPALWERKPVKTARWQPTKPYQD